MTPKFQKIYGVGDVASINTSLSAEVALSRFLCGILLHYAMCDYIRLGLDMTKFAINHPWKFKDPHTAFFCGFSKCAINFITEILNYSLLLTSNNVINCLWNFLGLNVIRTLGNYIYATIRHSPQKKNIADPKYLKIFTIQTTTSDCAKAEIPAHRLEPDGVCPEGEALEAYPK